MMAQILSVRSKNWLPFDGERRCSGSFRPAPPLGYNDGVSSPDVADIAEGSYCAACGYDLRATTTGRCPECGMAIGDTVRAEIPWQRRAQLGISKAFFKTLVSVINRTSLLRAAESGGLLFRPARQFRLICCVITWLPLAAAWEIGSRAGKLELTMVNQLFKVSALDYAAEGASGNFTLPFVQGVFLPGVISVMGLLFFVVATGLPSYWFDRRGLTPTRRRAALAMSEYMAGWLACLWVSLLVAIGGIGLIALAARGSGDKPAGIVGMVGVIATWGVLTAALAIYVLRLMAMMQQSIDASKLRRGSLLIGLPVLWLMAGGVCFVVLPWLAGYAWLLIDAFRGV